MTQWPSFETKDLDLNSDESFDEMQRRWGQYDREMQAIIAAGGVHLDQDSWWVDDATGDLIGPDPSIERPLTDEDFKHFKKHGRPFCEVFPELIQPEPSVMKIDDGPCIIVRGDMSYDSFVFIGPFENFAAANQYGQSYAEDDLWTIERLVKPEKKF